MARTSRTWIEQGWDGLLGELSRAVAAGDGGTYASLIGCATERDPIVGYALTGAKADERETLLGVLDAEPNLVTDRPGQTLTADKNYYGRQFETTLADAGLRLLRPARKWPSSYRGRGSGR